MPLPETCVQYLEESGDRQASRGTLLNNSSLEHTLALPVSQMHDKRVKLLAFAKS